jgi:hypothetical protein
MGSRLGPNDTSRPVNFSVTVEDIQSGEVRHSEFTYLEESMAPGEVNPVSFRVDPSGLTGLDADDYWVSLRNESGETLAAARLTVTP